MPAMRVYVQVKMTRLTPNRFGDSTAPGSARGPRASTLRTSSTRDACAPSSETHFNPHQLTSRKEPAPGGTGSRTLIYL